MHQDYNGNDIPDPGDPGYDYYSENAKFNRPLQDYNGNDIPITDNYRTMIGPDGKAYWRVGTPYLNGNGTIANGVFNYQGMQIPVTSGISGQATDVFGNPINVSASDQWIPYDTAEYIAQKYGSQGGDFITKMIDKPGGGFGLLAALVGGGQLLSGLSGPAAATEAALPSSYWDMVASAAPETATDVTAGTLGAEAGAEAGSAAGDIWSQLGLTPPPQASIAPGFTNATGATFDLATPAGWSAATSPLTLTQLAQKVAQITDPVSKASTASTLSKLVNGTATVDDLTKILGTIGATGLGMYSANQQSDALQNIYDTTRNDRLPALTSLNNAITNPDTWYKSAPAMGAEEAAMRKLSTGYGNVAESPGALSRLAAYNLGGYNDYIRALSQPAFGTANTEATTGTNAANAGTGTLTNLAGGLSDLINPKQSVSLSDLYNLVKLTNAGSSF